MHVRHQPSIAMQIYTMSMPPFLIVKQCRILTHVSNLQNKGPTEMNELVDDKINRI
jgi:hypothetical protein